MRPIAIGWQTYWDRIVKEFIVTITFLLLMGAAAQYRWIPISYEDSTADYVTDEKLSRTAKRNHEDGLAGCESMHKTNTPLANDRVSLERNEDLSSIHPHAK